MYISYTISPSFTTIVIDRGSVYSFIALYNVQTYSYTLIRHNISSLFTTIVIDRDSFNSFIPSIKYKIVHIHTYLHIYKSGQCYHFHLLFHPSFVHRKLSICSWLVTRCFCIHSFIPIYKVQTYSYTHVLFSIYLHPWSVLFFPLSVSSLRHVWEVITS